ncbi:DNA repair protein RadA [uncultured Clostridium sp.]|nr:DNA repair protein RadA [uncultured Clostridium sp.]
MGKYKKKGGEGVTERARSGTTESGLTAEERQRAIDLITEAEAERRISGKAVFDKGKFRSVKKERERITLVSMSDVEEEEITWLYQPYVPRGKVTICAAYPGTGKTYVLCYMTACVSTGRSFFNQVPFKDEPGKAIYLTAEDGIGDTIKKRLRICGANMENIATVTEKTALQFDSPEIEEFMKDFKPDLMIFDPFQAYIGAEINMNAPNETRDKLNHIADLAEKYDVAVVLICHFNKNGKGDAITRVLGSTDIMGICRSYIALGTVPGEDDMKFMSHEKSSLDKRGKTILFEIDPDKGGVVYLGENNLTMDDYTAIRNKKRASNAPAVEAAKQFIVNNMPEGRRLAKEIKNLATANKISDGSLQRAREELGIITRKTKEFPPHSIWLLPGYEEEPTEEPESVQEELDIQAE